MGSIPQDFSSSINNDNVYALRSGITFSEIEQICLDALKSYPKDWPNNHKYYNRVKVLMVMWDDSSHQDDSNDEEIIQRDLQTLFEHVYNYETVRLKLDIADPQTINALYASLWAETRDLEKNSLFIFYYGGPGSHEYLGDRRLAPVYRNQWYIVAKRQSDGLRRGFSFTQVRRELLDTAACDVLILMGCGYSVATGQTVQGKELIAAGGPSTTTLSNGQRFGKYLIGVLLEAYTKKVVLHTGQLYAELMQRYWQEGAGPGGKCMEHKPLHLNRSPEAKLPILLAPRDSAFLKSPSSWTNNNNAPMVRLSALIDQQAVAQDLTAQVEYLHHSGQPLTMRVLIYMKMPPECWY